MKSGGVKRRRRLLPPSKRQDMRSRKRSCFLLVPPSVGSSTAPQPFARHGRFVHTYRNYRYRRTVTSAYNTADSRLPFVPQRRSLKGLVDTSEISSRELRIRSALPLDVESSSPARSSFPIRVRTASASFLTGFFARMTYGARPIGRLTFHDSRALAKRARRCVASV